jgi:glycosyltransferase involved in cell wall biosynthesis
MTSIELPTIKTMESSEYLLIQPWFSTPGHPAMSLVRTYRATKSSVNSKVVVYLPKSFNISKQLDDYVSECNAVKISSSAWQEYLFGTLATGSWACINHLAQSRNTGTQSFVFLLDANLYILCLALSFFKVDPERLDVLCMVGPEFFQSSYAEKLVKWNLVKRLFYYKFFRLFLRTPELAESWKEELPDFKHKIDYLPSLELQDINIEEFKIYIQKNSCLAATGDKTERIYLVSGQIRIEKSIEILIKTFAQLSSFEKLRIFGAVTDRKVSEIIESHKSRLNIIVRNEFLTESEMAAEFSNAHYNLLLYNPWDHRMESAMLFMSLKYNLPVVCFNNGWLGDRVVNEGLGWTIELNQLSNLKDFLISLPLPNSNAYKVICSNISKSLIRYSAMENTDIFLRKIGWK